MLRRRIADERVLRLISRMLKSGILEEGLVQASEEGTPQGSILSPLLSNIYLHYALDRWFSRKVRESGQGEACYFRFADDFVACFQYRKDAQDYLRGLKERLERGGLTLAEEKTRCIEFGRNARTCARARGEKPEEFTFLGFTHDCGKTKRGFFKVKRRTGRKKLGKCLREFADWLRKARCVLRKGDLMRRARSRLMGHLNYFAITDNGARCSYFVYFATRLLFKWINRKSQRRAYTWGSFKHALACVDWPTARIRVNLNPCRV